MIIKRLSTTILLAGCLFACTTAGRPDLSGMGFADAPLTGKVVWHDLITEDPDAARRFYGGLFGWTFEDAGRTGAGDYTIARAGSVFVAGMVPIAPPGDGSNLSRWLPYVSVVNVDESLKRSIDAGATLVAPARDVAMGRVAAIVDPQGAVIGLARSSVGDPDDQTTSAAPGRVVWNEMLADDTAAAAAFYKRVADYDVQSVERRGGEYTFLASNGVRRAGINPLPADNVTPLWLTCFGVNDPAAAATLAETLGGKVILPASPDLRDGTIAVVTDPSGAVLVLQKWST